MMACAAWAWIGSFEYAAIVHSSRDVILWIADWIAALSAADFGAVAAGPTVGGATGIGMPAPGVTRPDGVDKVTGRAKYGADAFAPGQLVALVLRSPHAHATIKKIDISKAEKLAGVKAVITSADLPDLTGGDRSSRGCIRRGGLRSAARAPPLRRAEGRICQAPRGVAARRR